MSEHADKRVCLEPSEVQKLRLQLAQRDCQLNIAERCHMETELRLHRALLTIASATVPEIEAQLANLERENKQLTQRFFEVGEEIKAENGWPDETRWDATTLTYSAPNESGWTAVPEPAGENKIRIQ
jgi:hypothetical protein